MSTFTARYRTACPACGEPIHPGDTAKWTQDGAAHDACPDVADDLTVTRQPCPSCFTVPAVSGACACP